MAEEPQPSNVQEGADQPDALPANAEDRKAAAALSSLDAKGGDDGAAPAKKEVDLKALNDALKNLDTAGAGKGSSADKKKAAGSLDAKKKAEEPVKLIKVDAADVTLLAEQLDMSKPKATELLRANDANVVKAMESWVTSPVW